MIIVRSVLELIIKKRLLSHHIDCQLYRCFKVKILGFSFHICARCLGVLVGLISASAFRVNLAGKIWFSLSVIAVLDWALSYFSIWRGNNIVRVLSGVVLGIIEYKLLTWIFSGTTGNSILWSIPVLASCAGVFLIGKLSKSSDE